MRKKIAIVGIIVPLSLMAGCAPMINIQPQAVLLDNDQLRSQADLLDLTTQDWWRRYRQPALDALVSTAIAHNPSLKLAQARIRQADAAVSLVRSADGPTIDWRVGMTRQHLSQYGEVPPPLGGAMSSLYDTTLSFRYVFDLWGKTRADIAAALSEQTALQIEANEARRVLSLAVSSRYFQYQALQQEAQWLQQQVDLRQAILRVLRAQNQAGVAQKDPVDWMNSQLHVDQQQLAFVNAQMDKTQNALAALLGTTAAQLGVIAPMHLPMAQLTDLAALQTHLLGQRADIRAARWRVESYSQAMKAARAAFYPTVSLQALVGFNALALDDWFKRNAYQTFLTPALSLPIFHAGELRANLSKKTAQYDQAVENYNQTVLHAIQDAADKYADLRSAEQAVLHQRRAVQSARSATNVSADRYRVGILPKQNYLDAQYTLCQLNRQLNMAQHQRLQAELAMVQAIGGEAVQDKTTPILSRKIPHG